MFCYVFHIIKWPSVITYENFILKGDKLMKPYSVETLKTDMKQNYYVNYVTHLFLI